jgi:hypothetical protein
MDSRRESHSGAAFVAPELNPTPKTRRHVSTRDRRQLRKSEGRVAHGARYQLRFRLGRAVSGGRCRQHGLQNPSAWGGPLILCSPKGQRASLDQMMTCDHVALRDLRFAREP